MIKSYDPNFEGTHMIRITFMQWDFIGHIAFAIGGNCKGAALLNADFLDYDTNAEIGRYVENDCEFSFDEDCELYTAVLKNADGNTLDVDGDSEDFKDMIVCIEFSGLEVSTND